MTNRCPNQEPEIARQEATAELRHSRDFLSIRNPDRTTWNAFRKPEVLANPRFEIWNVIRGRYFPFLTNQIVAMNLARLVKDKRIGSEYPDVARILQNLFELQQKKQDELDQQWRAAEADAIAEFLEIPDDSLIRERDTGWHDYHAINREKAPWFFPPYKMDPECIHGVYGRFGESHPVTVKLRRIVERIDQNNRRYGLKFGG